MKNNYDDVKVKKAIIVWNTYCVLYIVATFVFYYLGNYWWYVVFRNTSIATMIVASGLMIYHMARRYNDK